MIRRGEGKGGRKGIKERRAGRRKDVNKERKIDKEGKKTSEREREREI